MSEELIHDNPTPPIETLLNAQEHEYSGLRYVETASYIGHVHGCLCGHLDIDRNELAGHITDALGHDALQNVLELAWARFLTKPLPIVERKVA